MFRCKCKAKCTCKLMQLVTSNHVGGADDDGDHDVGNDDYDEADGDVGSADDGGGGDGDGCDGYDDDVVVLPCDRKALHIKPNNIKYRLARDRHVV